MKLYQKILGISNVALLAGSIILVLLAFHYKSELLVEIAFFILFPLLLILSIVFMFLYKNKILRRAFLLGMPFILILLFISDFFMFPRIVFYLSLAFIIYIVLVNLVLHFFRYDLNFIIVTFLLIIGLLFKRWHWPGGGPIISLASLILCIYSLIISFRSFKIKDNRYLSILTFSCSLILAGQCASFMFKMQHWPGAGLLMGIFIPVFIIATLIILLTLPGSNFIEWTREQKKILLRGLLIPWLFFIYLMVTNFMIPPYNQFKPFFFMNRKGSEIKFNMVNYEIENKSGLEKDEN